MRIEIRNCNNIDFAQIELAETKLNIKFAPNGSGKSTIAKAIVIKALAGDLQQLLPFKLRRENLSGMAPSVNGGDSLRNILCFNEEYVSQFVFKPDELLSNSFDIFVKTEAYKKLEQEIEELIQSIKLLFTNNQELETLISTLKEMGNAFKLTKTGLSKASSGMKGLAGGNKIQHIPTGLESYKPFIQSQNSVSWIDWHTKGCSFSELSEDCPFCTAFAADKKERIKKVGQEYDKSTIKNLIDIIEVIEKLGDFFSVDAKEKLRTITTMKEGLGKEHDGFISSVKIQIDSFTEKLEKLRTISAFQFKPGDRVAEKLPAYKLDMQFFSELKSTAMELAVAPINESIEKVVRQAGELQGKINKHRAEIQKTINQHRTDINNFLAFAGYKYAVDIVGEGEQSHLKLRHADHEEHLSGGSQHLSYGERNAFALVLFMYECLAKKPDLIILDDPISSFDKNKKYAILEMLFRRDSASCLKNKTVLMLTHDIEPVIDTTKSLAQKFANQTVSSFLRMENGTLTELLIEKADVKTFSQVCKGALDSNKSDIVKLIYVRRNLEISNDLGDAYQVASNVLHQRTRALDFREPRNLDGNYPEMSNEKFTAGCTELTTYIPDFIYTEMLSKITDTPFLRSLYFSCNNGYEKLQLFRILQPNVENSVIQKFINETYHIENEFICQLDPAKYDTIPEYVVAECTKYLADHPSDGTLRTHA